MTFFLHRVLEPDLPSWTALGWREVARTYPQSLPCADVLVRWDGTEPRMPGGAG